MKTIKLSASKLVALTLLLGLFATSCKKEPVEPPKKSCEHKAVFEKMEGYDGFYGSYIIKLDEGRILYPCIVEDPTFNRDNIFEGMPITVSYDIIANEEIACKIPYNIYNAYHLPRYPFHKVKITCISDDRKTDAVKQGFCGTEW